MVPAPIGLQSVLAHVLRRLPSVGPSAFRIGRSASQFLEATGMIRVYRSGPAESDIPVERCSDMHRGSSLPGGGRKVFRKRAPQSFLRDFSAASSVDHGGTATAQGQRPLRRYWLLVVGLALADGGHLGPELALDHVFALGQVDQVRFARLGAWLALPGTSEGQVLISDALAARDVFIRPEVRDRYRRFG